MAKVKYPTRAELDAGAAPVTAVPRSVVLRLMTTGVGHALDKAAVRWFGLSFISWQASRLRGIDYQPCLLLTTIGRKTCKARTAVLPYVTHRGVYIVVGSNAGEAHNPTWVENARVNPDCTVRIKGRVTEVRAHLAANDERQGLLAVIAATRPQIYNYEAHAARHGRQLELVVLTPCST